MTIYISSFMLYLYLYSTFPTHVIIDVHKCKGTNLRYVKDEQTGHAGCNNHEDSQSISRVNEVVDSQDKTERCSNANKDHHNVHGDADKPWVIDVEVFNIPALIGQEESKHNKKSLVHIECSDEIAIIVTETLFVSTSNIIAIILKLIGIMV